MISLNLLVSDAKPKAEPRIIFVVTPNGPPISPAKAPRPILGSFFFTFSGKSGSNPSSPNKAFVILSLFFANPIADPTMIPVTGPPGTNGNIDVIAPRVAPFPISGKYLLILLLISFDKRPPWYSPSSIFPNNHVLTCSESLIRAIAEPAAAPNNGPPIVPVIRETPAPIVPPVNTSGAYCLRFAITSFVALAKSSPSFSFLSFILPFTFPNNSELN